MTTQRIQEILGAFLSAHGKHELATQAYAATSRLDWIRLGDDAIRSAPKEERVHVAQSVKLALDSPDIGGHGMALDFEIRPEPHVEQPNLVMYRAWMLPKDGGPAVDAGLAHQSTECIRQRIVGMHVARTITIKR